MTSKLNTEEMAIFCKKKGFIFQAAEIYGGFSGFFDFGPLGVITKNNIKQLYFNKFVLKREDIVAQDGSIITNPKVWRASGHVEVFGDMLLTTKLTKTKLRADHFIEDALKIPADGMSPKEIEKLIVDNNLKYKGEEIELPIQFFSGMLSTQVGADVSKAATAYLRPETAQSIFPNFRIIADTSRMSLPFGIVQIGKAFRNEISPRDFVFRCREFEQMELEYFFDPSTKCNMLTDKHLNFKFQFLSAESQDNDSNEMKTITISSLLNENKINSYHAYILTEFFMWFTSDAGFAWENLRVREHVKTELSHYSKGTFDIDYNYPFGFKEMIGIASRGDYDLKQHQEHSKTKLEFFDEESKKKFLPHVIEPSLGVERFMMAIMFESYKDLTKERGNIVLQLPYKIAPYTVGVFPLMNKDGLSDVARKIYTDLIEEDIATLYDKSGSVGKRYARSDEIGVPFCITVDYECLEDGKDKETVTLRDRDSTKQVRIKVEKVPEVISNLVKGKIKFDDLK